ATGAKGSQILGIGAARGDLVVPNSELVEAIDSSDEWIRQRTGIITRKRASKGVNAIDLAETASLEALKNAGVAASDIDAVIVSTISNVAVTPSMSALLAERIGAAPAPAYDVGAACAGYTYGIAQADALIRSGTAKYVLVVGAEKLSQYVHPNDRSISFLLGDGAGAAVLGPTDDPGVSATVWGSDGSKWDAVGMNATFEEYLDKVKPWPTMRQDGQTVFRWAVWEMAKVAKQAIEAAGITVDDLDAFIPHQANMRIIDELAKQLKLPEHVKIGRDIETTGNTSAASIPLATHRLLEENPEMHGGLALQIGFGAGLVYGAQVVRLP
ncbi:MAG TPA: beta-ketoacyl-ACP synthase III, partial [Pseudolysinimonas sp.]|nr:beta-ketoacyl-ACP synthase III [Pseudolysinimonas sp.]